MLNSGQGHSRKYSPMHWRGSKYGNKPVMVDGIRFASKREAKRYAELVLLAKANEIWQLEIQPEFEFELHGSKIFKYIADFSYWTRENGELVRVVEDAKGVKTPLYRLKKKLIEAAHNIEIREV